MCAHEISYVYSHVCVKAPCFDDNLVRYLHISAFGTLSQEYCYKNRTRDVVVSFCCPKLCENNGTCLVRALWKVIGLLRTIAKVCVLLCCMSSLEDRVVIVPHELTSMIHGLVLTSHLQDELA